METTLHGMSDEDINRTRDAAVIRQRRDPVRPWLWNVTVDLDYPLALPPAYQPRKPIGRRRRPQAAR